MFSQNDNTCSAKKRFTSKVSCIIYKSVYTKLQMHISVRTSLNCRSRFVCFTTFPLLWLNTWRTLTGIYENPQAKLFHTIQLNATMHQFSIIFINKCLMFSINVQRMSFYEWTFSKQKRTNDKQQMPLIACGHFVQIFQLNNMKEPEIQFCLKITTIMVWSTRKTEYGCVGPGPERGRKVGRGLTRSRTSGGDLTRHNVI